MSEDFLRAVSVGNSYFALADGLAQDLESHLAEDVLLDFFGQTVKGRKNVAAFMKYQKISRHDFEEILPKMSIGYRENRSLRRKYHSAGNIHDNNNAESPSSCESKYKRKCYSDAFYRNQRNMDDSFLDSSEFEMDLNTTTELSSIKIEPEVTESLIERELDISGLQLDSFSTPQIAISQDKDDSGASMSPPDVGMTIFPEPTQMEAVEMHISQLKAREMIKTECGQGDAKISSLKFLEASGSVEFSKVFSPKQVRKDTRKRQCRLQIAYSTKNENSNMKVSQKPESTDFVTNSTDFSQKMDEDDEDERNQFLQCLQLQLSAQGGNINNLMTPKYVRGQLKFDKPQKSEITKDFVFNYEIHVIIYGGNTKCRLNLSQEFEGKEYSEENV